MARELASFSLAEVILIMSVIANLVFAVSIAYFLFINRTILQFTLKKEKREGFFSSKDRLIVSAVATRGKQAFGAPLTILDITEKRIDQERAEILFEQAVRAFIENAHKLLRHG